MAYLFISRRNLMLGAAALLFILSMSLTFTAEAAPALSGRGTATIDGYMSPGEWDSADTLQFNINGKYTPYAMTLYVMNDDNNLYFALVHQGNPQGLYWTESANITLDKNRSKSINVGDDSWNLINQYFPPTSSRNETFTDSYVNFCSTGCGTTADTNNGGTNDGSGAIANDGSQTVYEFSHPLNTSDNSNDISMKLKGFSKRIHISGDIRIEASPIQVYASGSIPLTKIKLAR